MSNNQFQEIINNFYKDGENIAESKERSTSSISLLNKQRTVYNNIGSFIDSFLQYASQAGTPCECQKGCDSCCHQTVLATNLEVDYLYRWIEKNMPKEKKELFFQKAYDKSAKAADMDSKTRLKFKYACPFLEDGACAVYPARPMACRIYLSQSKQSCDEERKNPEGKSFAQLYDLPLKCGQMLNEGYYSVLKKEGLTVEEFPLEYAYLKKVCEESDEPLEIEIG